MTAKNLSDYDLGAPLGKGGMAEVFQATYRPTGEVVALKRMLSHVADNDTYVARFIREVELSSRLRSESVVRVHGFGKGDDGTYFLALEYCDGGTLVQLLKAAPRVPAPLVALILDEMLAGLEEAHALGIIHRDIKPPNILVTTTGHFKLADFGIARSASDETLTATGEVIGTPAYMSPEQAKGLRDLDGRSDLFAVGMLAYRMIVGSNPYASDNVVTSILRVTTGPDLRIADVAQTVPAILEAVIDGLVRKNRDERLASATAARALLAPIVANLGARFPDVLARFVANPAQTAQGVARAFAADEIASARACVDGAPARAVVHAARAQAYDPSDLDAASLLEKLSTLHGFHLAESNDVRIANARRELDERPTDIALLRKLANLYRGAQNPLEAARYLKRYLSLKPDDAMARSQLEELVGADDVAALTGAAPGRPALRTGDIMRGVKTGGFGAAASSASPTQTAQPAPRALTTSSPRAFGGPVVIAADGPSDQLSGATKLFLVLGAFAVVAAGVAIAGDLLKKGSDSVDHTLRSVEATQTGMLSGLVDGTQGPFIERARQSARVRDWQGVVETTNFGLSADPDMRSQSSATLLLLRGKARHALGEGKQGLIDVRLAQSLAADGSETKKEAEALLTSWSEGAAPQAGGSKP